MAVEIIGAFVKTEMSDVGVARELNDVSTKDEKERSDRLSHNVDYECMSVVGLVHTC
jgi:hypothetical protein